VNLADSNSSKIVLFQSTSGCLDVQDYSITYINIPKCTNITSEKDSNSVFIVLAAGTNCGKSNVTNNSDTIIVISIIVGIVVGLVVIFFAIVLSVPKLRNKVFPSMIDKLDQRRL